MSGPATKPSDREVEAAIAAFLANGGKVKRPPPPKPIAKRESGPIQLSRVAARPLTMKLTIGYPERALRDDYVTRR